MHDKPVDDPAFDGDLGELEEFVDYLAGIATPQEREVLEARLRKDPALHRRLDQTRLLWERSGSAFDIADPDVAVEALRSRIARSIGSTPEVVPRTVPPAAASAGSRRTRIPAWRSSGYATTWYRGLIAASILLVAIVGSWQAGLFAPSRDTTAGTMSTESTREFVSAPGERRVLSLPDGSRITLAPGSLLRTSTTPYSATGAREVHLEGHAYFEVASDPAHPFLVHTARAVTRVLGTEFAVRAYRGTAETQVLVRSGTVALSSDPASGAEARVLTSGVRGTVEEGGQIRVESGVDTNSALSWTEGTLVFRATPVKEVISELEHWYGIEIRVADPAMGERRITATVFSDEPLDLVLRAMGDLLNARWQRTNGRVVFTPI